jgi:putative transposase
MKKSKFTEQQIAFAFQQAEGGTNVAEVCRSTPGVLTRPRPTRDIGRQNLL